MTNDDKLIYEKLQCGINRKATKILKLSSRKIDKYEYLTGEEILPFYQKRVIKQASFAYSQLRKAFQKQAKTNEVQVEKQLQLEIIKSN